MTAIFSCWLFISAVCRSCVRGWQDLTGIVACPANSQSRLCEGHRGDGGLGEGGANGPVGGAEHLLMTGYEAHTSQGIDEQVHAW